MSSTSQPSDPIDPIDPLPTRDDPSNLDASKRRRSRKSMELDAQELALAAQRETIITQELRNANFRLENIRFRFDLYLRLIAAILIPTIVIYWLVRVLTIVTAQQLLAKE